MDSDFFDKNVKFSVKRKYLYEQIADGIEKMIVDQPAMIGQKLPSEQALADSFNVSRNVIRESFKVLKERGLIEVNNGACAYVTRPSDKTIQNVIGRYINMDFSQIEEAFEVRFALEIYSVRLAIRRANENGLKKCEECIKKMEENMHDRVLWSKYDYDFHYNMVSLTGNSLIMLLYNSLSDAIKKIFEVAHGRFYDEKGTKKAIAHHRNIIDAIRKRDENLAVEQLISHLNTSEFEMKEYLREKINNS